MATPPERKLFLGARLKRIRRELGCTQSRMAEDLGVSPSYLNLLERNQRPVTAQVLLRLAEAYDLDLKSLAADPDSRGESGLAEVFADGLFRDIPLPRHELAEVAENAPGVAEAVLRLYQAYLDRQRLAELGLGRPEEAGQESPAATPSDWVREYIRAQRNHFPELEARGEGLAEELAAAGEDFAAAARARLQARHGVQVRVAPPEVLPESLRRYDQHRRRLYLSELLTPAGRAFSLAYQLALMELADPVRDLVARGAAPDRPTEGLLKVSLINYAAAAVLMPYGPFFEAVEKCGYDIDRARARFGASFEQACHRLTTLARPGQRGVPFFMLRVDAAGNISKRFASGPFPFSRFGGACPRWAVHASFRTPGRVVTQVVETPDGALYFTLARTVRRLSAPLSPDDGDLAIGLGCEIRHASRLVYARALDLAHPAATPIGPACRVCERPACPQRSSEPINRTLMVDDFTKSITPFPFASAR